MAGKFEGLKDAEWKLFEDILLVDAEGMPVSAVTIAANADERKQVPHLLDGIEVKTGKLGIPDKKLRRIAADKGYDSENLRNFLWDRGIQPKIPRNKNAKQRL